MDPKPDKAQCCKESRHCQDIKYDRSTCYEGLCISLALLVAVDDYTMLIPKTAGKVRHQPIALGVCWYATAFGLNLEQSYVGYTGGSALPAPEC